MNIDPSIEFYMRIPLGGDVFTNGRIDYTTHPAMLGIRDVDLAGARVLDIATNDGFWVYWAEKQGAEEMIGIDVSGFEQYDWGFAGPTGWRGDYHSGHDFSLQWQDPRVRFEAIREYLGSRAEHIQMSVYELDPRVHGTFDLVFNYGLLYHLRHPLLSLDRVRAVTTGALVLETHTVNSFQRTPAYFFYEGAEYREPTNWTGPTEACVVAWLRSAGFGDIWVRRPRGDLRSGRTIFAAGLTDEWRDRFDSASSLTLIDASYFDSLRQATQQFIGEEEDER